MFPASRSSHSSFERSSGVDGSNRVQRAFLAFPAFRSTAYCPGLELTGFETSSRLRSPGTYPAVHLSRYSRSRFMSHIQSPLRINSIAIFIRTYIPTSELHLSVLLISQTTKSDPPILGPSRFQNFEHFFSLKRNS